MNRIAELRKEKHLNQVGLAMELNISQYTVSALETGRQQPSADILVALSVFFDVSIDYILRKSNVRFRSDEIMSNYLSDKEIKLLDMFKTLSKEKQEQAIGIVFALKNY